jgi:hypothetical protein
VVDRLTAGSLNIRLATTTPTSPPNKLHGDQRHRGAVAERSGQPFERGDDRVDCRRHRLQGDDQHGKGGARRSAFSRSSAIRAIVRPLPPSH